MKIRLGVCSDCGAQYKIPVSFSANRAKCKQCGGVTEIGPPVADPDAGAPAKKVEAKGAAPAKPPVKASKKNAPPMPAKKVRPGAEKSAGPKAGAKRAAPKKSAPAKGQHKNPQNAPQRPVAKGPAPAKPVQKAAAPKPKAPAARVDDGLVEIRGSGKKKDGMSMKERLLAERAAAAKGASPAQRTKAGPPATPKAQVKRPAAGAAGVRAAAGAGAVRAGSKAGAAAPSTRRGGTTSDRAPRTSSRSSARSGQRRGGRRGAVDEDEEIAGASRSSGGRRARQKQSKVPMFVGLGLLAAAGVGGFLYVQNQNKKTVEAANEEVAAGNPVDAADAATAASEELIDPNEINDLIGEPENDEAGETPADTAEETPADEAPAAAPGGEAAKPEAAKPVRDPAEIDLTVYDFERAEGTTDEEWADIVGDVETAIDPDAGAAGTRALTRLRDTGRKAFPAVLNAMHDLDYTTEEGLWNGDVLQKCLREILAGLSFGWFYPEDPDNAWKNKKAVQRLSNEWAKVVEDPSYWDKISAKKARKEAERKSEPDPLSEELEAELDDLDDLDDL